MSGKMAAGGEVRDFGELDFDSESGEAWIDLRDLFKMEMAGLIGGLDEGMGEM